MVKIERRGLKAPLNMESKKEIEELKKIKMLARGLCLSMQSIEIGKTLNPIQEKRLMHLYAVLFTCKKEVK